MEYSALLTDFYSLTMAQGYWKQRIDQQAVFEMFFRRQPFNGGFSIFAGLEPLLDTIQHFSFSSEDCEYLSSLGRFDDQFLSFLEHFQFRGDLYAMDEGTVIFPREPLIRIEGNLIECQLIEGMLLNTINFQSLIATKAARVWLASGKGTVMEFGLRRAQGQDGALSASRAAYIGGVSSTSNVLAGKKYSIPVMGTMAHAWVMSFPNEEEAFQRYADFSSADPVFLIDTYNTLKSGMPSAIAVGSRLGDGRNFGVRLDSGDIYYLSAEVRAMLDKAGFPHATISVSNDLDESIIEALVTEQAPVDLWGVGTKMVTAAGDSAFTGVYKLVMRDAGYGSMLPVIKLSDNPEKTTIPGIKQVWRLYDSKHKAVADVLTVDPSESLEVGKRYMFWHPSGDYRHFSHTVEEAPDKLLKLRLHACTPVAAAPSLETVRQRVRSGLDSFDPTYLRLLNPHAYKVSLTEQLRTLMLDSIQQQFHV
ncbi:MAG: nicotinate phosphoribosyltransferase [Treponema sp.]|nr:nicotinate phosphoribosyltransferase [Treponema sp.]